MRKSFLKVMALGVFALAGGAAVAHGKMVDGTIWVYEGTPGGTTTAAEPNCNSSSSAPCAREHYYDEDTQTIGAATGEVRYGARY